MYTESKNNNLKRTKSHILKYQLLVLKKILRKTKKLNIKLTGVEF